MKHLLSVCQLPPATFPSFLHLPLCFSFLWLPLSPNFSLKYLLDFTGNEFSFKEFPKAYRVSSSFSISHSPSVLLLCCSSVYLSNSIILSFITEAFASHTPAVWFICFHPFFAVSLSHPLQLQLSLNFLHLADTPLPPNPAVCLPSFFPSASRSVLGGNGINTLHVKGIRMIRWLVTVKVFSHI